MSPTLIALCCFLVVGILHVVVPRLVLNGNKRHLLALCQARRAIVITFDDGPGRLLTPLVVRRLAEAKVPATFFLLGHNVKDNEDVVDQIRESGNELGSHGEEHVHHLWSWPWAGLVDTALAWRRLRDLLRVDSSRMPFRPPYGKMNLVSLLWVMAHRTPVTLWTHDSYDTWHGVDRSPEQLAEGLRADGGGVVLLHDFDRSVKNADTEVLAKLEAVLELRNQGYTFLRVGELLGLAPPAAVG